jgi:hypothetical protein
MNYLTTFENFNTNEPSIESLVLEIQNRLEFQRKVHLHHLSQLEGDKKIKHLIKIKESNLCGIFGNDELVLENYQNEFGNYISESIIDYESEIKRFDRFIVKSIMKKLYLSEQFKMVGGKLVMDDDITSTATDTTSRTFKGQDGKQVTTAKTSGDRKVRANTIMCPKCKKMNTKDKCVNCGQDLDPSWLKQAVNYVKENGISTVFENIREALFSGIGTAIQIALSFTGAGNIAVGIVWGIMAVYDGYQVSQGKLTNLAYLVVDLICVITSGVIGKAFGKITSSIAGKSFSKVGQVIEWLLSTSIGKMIKNAIMPLIEKASSFLSVIKEGVNFIVEKMGQSWAGKIFEFISKKWIAFVNGFKSILQKGGEFVGKILAKTILKPGTLRIASNLSGKFSPNTLTKLAQMGEGEVAEYCGQQIPQYLLKAAEKEATDQLKDKPTEEAIKFIDKKFGTAISDLYLAYKTGKKLFKFRGKNLEAIADDAVIDTLRGKPLTGQFEVTQKAATSIVKAADTSTKTVVATKDEFQKAINPLLASNSSKEVPTKVDMSKLTPKQREKISKELKKAKQA